jgi:multisubunit Na+/H+ antiporter MnhC subunit
LGARTLLLVVLLVFLLGLSLALGSRHVIKRLIGVALAQGAGLVALVGTAGGVGTLAAVQVGFLALGLATAVRVHEAYGTLEVDRVDAQDEADTAHGLAPGDGDRGEEG